MCLASFYLLLPKVAIDGWNCVMKVMRLSSVFMLELHVKNYVRVIREMRLICSEINL